jgi:hypothetical protein
VDGAALSALTLDFLRGIPFDWSVLEPSWHDLQSQSLLLQIHNPLLASRLIYSSLALKPVTDTVLTSLWNIERVASARTIDLLAANAVLASRLAVQSGQLDELLNVSRRTEAISPSAEVEKVEIRSDLARYFKSEIRIGAAIIAGTLYHDSWTTPELQISIFPHARVGQIQVRFSCPKVRGPRTVRLFADGVLVDEVIVEGGGFGRVVDRGNRKPVQPILLALEVKEGAGGTSPTAVSNQHKRPLGVVLREVSIIALR